MRKMRKQVTGRFNSRDFSLEPGDRVYSSIDGKVYDLYESNGMDKVSSGELSYREPAAQKAGKVAIKIDSVWYWK